MIPNLRIALAVYTYPIPPKIQAALIKLWRTEWTRTDYDWLHAMHGDYGEALAIISAVARLRGEAVATATIHFCRPSPEIGVLGNVVTHHDYRGLGLGGQVLEVVLAQAKRAGCEICLLGTSKRPENVYLRHGFSWRTGVMMRKCFGNEDFEHRYFARNQPAAIRPANWGDLPGLTLLMAEPLPTICLDFPRGFLSARHSPAARCLSYFPVLWQDTVARDGVLATLAGPKNRRIFGFGSATRDMGAARQHGATVEIAAHANYESYLPAMLSHLLTECRERGVRRVQAFVAENDFVKRDCFQAEAFTATAKMQGALQVGIAAQDATLFTRVL